MIQILALLLLLAVGPTPDPSGSWRLDNIVQDGQLSRDPRWTLDLTLEAGRFTARSVVQGEKYLTGDDGQPKIRGWREETTLQGRYDLRGARLVLTPEGEQSESARRLAEVNFPGPLQMRWDGDRLVLEGKSRTLYLRRWRL